MEENGKRNRWVSTTVRCVIASRTNGGTAATDAASTGGTSASAATTAWMAFAATDAAAPAMRSIHGYQASRWPASATTATVPTTMIPSTMSGHAHACVGATPGAACEIGEGSEGQPERADRDEDRPRDRGPDGDPA